MANIKQNDDGSAGIINSPDGKELLRVGGPATPAATTGFTAPSDDTHLAVNVAKVTLGIGTGALTNSLVLWQPPNNSEDVIVTRVVVSIGTTAQANMACGTAISNSISSSNIIDALSLSSPGLFDNITDKGSNGKSRQYLTAGSFVVASPSATPANLVGTMFIEYYKA